MEVRAVGGRAAQDGRHLGERGMEGAQDGLAAREKVKVRGRVDGRRVADDLERGVRRRVRDRFVEDEAPVRVRAGLGSNRVL